jgi:hypothetical protein
MKTIRQICATIVLITVLAFSAFAGEMSTGIATPPPPTQQGEMSTTVSGQMDTGITTTDTATEIALNLLPSLLALF